MSSCIARHGGAMRYLDFDIETEKIGSLVYGQHEFPVRIRERRLGRFPPCRFAAMSGLLRQWCAPVRDRSFRAC